MYGCQDIAWGILGHFEWATFMSRVKYADARGVKNAKTKLTAIEYNWSENWMKPGVECGIDAAPTADELFLTMIETKPDFTDYDYDHEGTKYAREFFETSGHFPVGFLTGPLAFGGDNDIKTSFKTQVQTSDYQSYFVIANMEYALTSLWNYDIYILTIGLSTEALAELTKIAAAPTKYYWKDYEKYCTGYARIIQSRWSDKYIGAFREGYFAAGVQSKFGRVMDNISKSTMISYTGNWATSSAANGIAVISSSYTVFQGTFNSNSNFPLSGLDSLKTEKTITTLV